MNNNDKIIRRTDEKGTIEDMTRKGLESNCWIIDNDIKFVKQLNAYNSILADLNYSKECIIELKNRKDKERENNTERIIIKSLFTSSIISYARCFNSSKKDGRISIDFNSIKKYLAKDKGIGFKELFPFHQYLIKLRNKFIAHADKNDYESERLYVEYNYDGEYLNYNFNSYELKMNSFDEIQMKNFLVIIETLLIIVNDKKDILLPKLKEEIGDKKLIGIGIKIAKKTKANNG